MGPPGTRYDNAYFEIKYVRTYTQTAVPAPTGSSASEQGDGSVPVNSGGRVRSGWGVFVCVGLVFWILCVLLVGNPVTV